MVVWPVATSIDDRLCANTRVANTVFPSGLTVRPPTKLSPLTAGSANVRERVITPSA